MFSIYIYIMLKIATDLDKVKELIESKFTPEQIAKADYFLEGQAIKKGCAYIRYLRIVSQTQDLPATARLLGLYLIYLYK